MCICDDQNNVFQALFCNAERGDLEDKGVGNKNSSSIMQLLESPILICVFSMQLLWSLSFIYANSL